MSRKYLKPNPFEATRRSIVSQFNRIEQQILEKFVEGEPRQIMRITIRELLQKEATIQAKIKKLIAILDYHVLAPTQYSEDPQQSRSSLFQLNLDLKYRHKGKQYSPRINHSNNILKSSQNYNYYTQNQQSYSNASLYSQHSPASRLLRNDKSNQKLFSQSKQQKKSEAGHKLYDSVNQKDLFSFRTQKEELSLTQKRKNNILQLVKNDKNQSIQYLQNSSVSKSKSKSKNKQKKQKLNYDGHSQTYNCNTNVQRKSTVVIDPLKLYTKILNRLKFSSCIIQKPQHSTSPATICQLQNRYKLQVQVHTSLVEDVIRQYRKSPSWK